MPLHDKTGPLGRGPATGRALGPCGRGLAQRRGFGGRAPLGRCAYQPEMTEKEERELLGEEAKMLEQELKVIKERLAELKEKK